MGNLPASAFGDDNISALVLCACSIPFTSQLKSFFSPLSFFGHWKPRILKCIFKLAEGGSFEFASNVPFFKHRCISESQKLQGTKIKNEFLTKVSMYNFTVSEQRHSNAV